jgi:hypothetical protein
MPLPPETPTFAETRARLAQMWDRVHPKDSTPLTVERLASDAPGFTAWRVSSPDGSSTVVLPSLDLSAPFEIHRRYLARVIADATGICPLCSAVAGVSRDPDDGRAAFALLPVVVTVRHFPGCGAQFGEDERGWFPAVARHERRRPPEAGRPPDRPPSLRAGPGLALPGPRSSGGRAVLEPERDIHRQHEHGAVRQAGQGSEEAMTKMMPASHDAIAQRDAVAAALNDQWRQIDPPPKVTPKRPATVKAKPAKRPPAKQPKPSPAKAPPGLVLTPDEVVALDALLATHPALAPEPKLRIPTHPKRWRK